MFTNKVAADCHFYSVKGVVIIFFFQVGCLEPKKVEKH